MNIAMLTELLKSFDPSTEVMVETSRDDGWKAVPVLCVTTNNGKALISYDIMAGGEDVD